MAKQQSKEYSETDRILGEQFFCPGMTANSTRWRPQTKGFDAIKRAIKWIHDTSTPEEYSTKESHWRFSSLYWR